MPSALAPQRLARAFTLIVLLTLGLVGAGASRAAGSGDAVGYQIDPAHTGVQVDASLAPPYVRRWSAYLPGNASYGVIADGKVFVAVATSGVTVMAFDQASGSVAWQKDVPTALYQWAGIAYGDSRIYVLTFGGSLTALDAASGTQMWSVQLPYQWAFTSPPTAVGGLVYVSGAGSGGTAYAVDGATGSVVGTQAVVNGDHSAPTVADGAVFTGYVCNQVFRFDLMLATTQWQHAGACSGGGGRTTVYAKGRLFTRDLFGNLVLDAATGIEIGRFPVGDPIPAVDGDDMWTYQLDALTHRDVVTGLQRWSYVPADGDRLVTAPIVVVAGTQRIVLAGSSLGRLYAIDDQTGTLTWSDSIGYGFTAPDEHNVQLLPTLTAGAGIIVAPTGGVLTVYEHNALPPVTCDLSGYRKKGVLSLRNANLSGCSLAGVDLTGIDVSQANLRGVDFSSARLVRTNLSGSNLRGAVLRNADLTGARLSRANLANVLWRATRCPDGSDSDLNGGTCQGHLA